MSPLPGTAKVGIFSQQELTRLVEQTVPTERNGVPVENALVMSVDVDGVALSIKMEKGEHWRVESVIRRDWSGDIKAGAKVAWSW